MNRVPYRGFVCPKQDRIYIGADGKSNEGGFKKKKFQKLARKSKKNHTLQKIDKCINAI